MSSVSRSVYQKKHEECKKLLEDIRVLVEEDPLSKQWLFVFERWEKEFYRKREIDNTIIELFSHYRKSKIQP